MIIFIVANVADFSCLFSVDDAATMSSDAGSSAAISTTAPAQDLDPQSTTPTKNNAEARFAMLPLFAMSSVVFWVQYLSNFV